MPLSDYDELRQAVREAGFFTTEMPMHEDGDRIVLASLKLPRGYTGNSFWVAKRDDEWYIATWGGHIYHIPNPADLIDLCLTWLPATNETVYDFDEALVTQYGLVELTEQEADERFPGPYTPNVGGGSWVPVWPYGS